MLNPNVPTFTHHMTSSVWLCYLIIYHVYISFDIQRFYKLIYLHLPTYSFMKISLGKCRQMQINWILEFLCIKLSIEHSTTWDSRTNLNYTSFYQILCKMLMFYFALSDHPQRIFYLCICTSLYVMFLRHRYVHNCITSLAALLPIQWVTHLITSESKR